MRTKLLRIKLERFETGRPLARQIYLELPVNRKMICVAAAGDDIRPNLLARLPVKGVQALYARPLPGEHRNPETFPIYVDRSQLEGGMQEELSHRIYPELVHDTSNNKIRAGFEEESESAIKTMEMWEQEALRFAREASSIELHKLQGGEHKLELVSISGEIPVLEEESEDRFFPRKMVEEYQALDRKPEKRSEDTQWIREVEEKSFVRLFPEEQLPLPLKVLGEVIVKVVREFASSGDMYKSQDLKTIAGALARTAQMFFNLSPLPGASSDTVARVLFELREYRRDLRMLALHDGYANFDKLSLALDQAILAFRRGVRAEKLKAVD